MKFGRSQVTYGSIIVVSRGQIPRGRIPYGGLDRPGVNPRPKIKKCGRIGPRYLKIGKNPGPKLKMWMDRIFSLGP